jgi:hypothetical protein
MSKTNMPVNFVGESVTLIPTQKMDLDLSSLWSWTVPLWGLLVIVFFLTGVMLESVVLRVKPMVGSGLKKQVRFSNV